MRILLISEFYPPKISGIGQHVRRLAVSLAKRDHEVQVLSSDSSHKCIENDGNVRVIRTNHALSNLNWIFTDKNMSYVAPMPDFILKRAITKVILTCTPDIVHVHGLPMFTVAALKKRFPHLPMISTLHDYGFFCPKQTSFDENKGSLCHHKKPLIAKCPSCARNTHGLIKSLAITASLLVFRKLLNNFDNVVAVSNYLRNVAKEVGFHNVRVIPNFIDLTEIKTIEKSCHSNGRFSLTDILYVGALTAYKGVPVLLKAYKTLRKDPDFISGLTLVGRLHQKLSLNVSDSRIKTVFNMPGNIAFSYIQHAKMVVVPSIWPESFSFAALEAMAFKKPVIASATGGLTEIVQDQETGLLVPPNHYLELASAIKYLLEEPKRRKSMGIEGYKRVAKWFSVEKVLPQIEKMYEEVSE